MRDNKWRNLSVKIVLLLFSICVLLFAFSFLSNDEITGKEIAENTNVPIGKTVFAGDTVFAENEMVKVPLISNMNYLTQQIIELDLKGILISLSTGAVPVATSSISSGGISSSGKAMGFDGPGYLTLEGENLVVKGPNQFVWGYNTEYKYLKKTDSGVDIYENNTKIGSIAEDDLKNQDFGNSYYNITSVINWYNYGDDPTYVLEKGLGNFSDNRSSLSPDKVKEYFGNDIANYSAGYPVGSPVMVYAVNYTEESGETYGTVLGAQEKYDNSVRIHNGANFCKGWNGTIIPPNSYATGRSYISFGSVPDPEAPGGSAAHGVCPPSRSLRSAALSEGFDLPIGLSMSNDNEALMFGYKPCEDVKVFNNHDYPVQIIMWAEGSGTDMVLYGKMVRYIPN